LVKITDAEIALIKDALIEAELFGARTAKVQRLARHGTDHAQLPRAANDRNLAHSSRSSPRT
jgi:hypothetical protein